MGATRDASTGCPDAVTCRPTPVQSKITAFKATKPGVSKRKSKKYLQALQRPIAPPGKRYPVKTLEGGLVDVRESPDYLVPAWVQRNDLRDRSQADQVHNVKRNVVASPLLRLPSHIRELIWKYAMGGSTTAICLRNNDKELKTSNTAPDSPYHGTLSHVGSDRKKQRTAFHLPEVCREIYSETATLGYAPERILLRWQGSWTRGHAGRRHGGMYLGKRNWQTFKQLYPRLKQLRVPKRMVGHETNWPGRGDPMRKHLRQQAKDRVAKQIRDQEGGDVDVVF